MKKLFNSKYSESSISLGLFLLRLFAGGLIIPSGYQKLTHFSSMSKGFTDPFHIGSQASLSLLIFAELFCAILIVLGLLTRLAAIPLIIAMSVAFFMAHHGKITGEGNGSYALLFLGCYLVLLITGPGKYSADRSLGK
jgi:putative oxidoreductase